MRKNHRDRHNHLILADEQDVELDASAHVAGVHQGNLAGSAHVRERSAEDQEEARRSTGIAPEDREPIDPAMPTLPPA